MRAQKETGGARCGTHIPVNKTKIGFKRIERVECL